MLQCLRHRLSASIVLMVLWVAPYANAQVPGNPECVASYKCGDGTCTLALSFVRADVCRVRIDDPFVRRNAAQRVTEATDLRLRVDLANHLKYALKVDTKEVVVESYVHLERIWSQVLGRGTRTTLSAASLGADEQAFVDAIQAWRTRLAERDDALSSFVGGFGALVLTRPQADAIGAEGRKVEQWINELAPLQGAASAAIWRSENFAVFDGTNALHTALVARLRSFETLAGYCDKGFTRNVEFGPAGRIVTATVTASQRSSSAAADESLVVEFLVHSKLPLTFHAGFAYRRSSEVQFEPVTAAATTAGGADLFSRINGSKDTATLTAYMSYRLPGSFCAVGNAGVGSALCPQATLGTDFAELGERFYFGLSWQIGRTFLTVGGVSVQETQGAGPVDDVIGAIGNLTTRRELFTSIAQSRKAKLFAGISFAPF